MEPFHIWTARRIVSGRRRSVLHERSFWKRFISAKALASDNNANRNWKRFQFQFKREEETIMMNRRQFITAGLGATQPGYAQMGAGSAGKPGPYQKTASENAPSGRDLHCPSRHPGSADCGKSPFVGGRDSHKTKACILCFPISGAASGTLSGASVYPLWGAAPVYVQEDGKTAGGGAAEGNGIRETKRDHSIKSGALYKKAGF